MVLTQILALKCVRHFCSKTGQRGEGTNLISGRFDEPMDLTVLSFA